MFFSTDLEKLKEEAKYPFIYLKSDDWNDYGYITNFSVEYAQSPSVDLKRIGYIRIGKKGMLHDDNKKYLVDSVRTDLPDEIFTELGRDYFSLAIDSKYYEELRRIGVEVANEVLAALNDVAYSSHYLEIAKLEPVFTASLLRDISLKNVKEEFVNVINDEKSIPREYRIRFKIEQEVDGTDVTFDVIPNSFPRSNIHVLIGRNGVGKSHFFKAIIDSQSESFSGGLNSQKNARRENYFSEITGFSDISSILAVGYSAFDTTLPRDDRVAVIAEEKLRYTFIGLPELLSSPQKEDRLNNSVQNSETIDNILLNRFLTAKKEVLKNQTRSEMLNRSLKRLQSDPVFRNHDTASVVNSPDQEMTRQFFGKLSSGHKIALLTIVEIVRNIENYSMVLVDEPETHLHPPLLSSFVQAIEDIVVEKNAICIVATHSPIILQEVPRDCVWIIDRFRTSISVRRPQIETYGENLNTLLREVFKLEVDNSGFQKTIRDIVMEFDSIDEIRKKFHNKLSVSAELIALTYLEMKKNGDNIGMSEKNRS